jgi:hypothetical protein
MGRGAQIALIGSDGVVRYLDRQTLETLAQFSVDALDLVDGDCDRELIDEAEPDYEEGSPAWVEWHTMRGSQKRGPNIAGENEDDEDGDCDHGGDEGEPNFDDPPSRRDRGPGCMISDPDYGGEEAGEPEHY